jgi:hypothetical protein
MALQNEAPLSFWDFFQFRGTAKFYPKPDRVWRILDVAQTKVKYDRLWRFSDHTPYTAPQQLAQHYSQEGRVYEGQTAADKRVTDDRERAFYNACARGNSFSGVNILSCLVTRRDG